MVSLLISDLLRTSLSIKKQRKEISYYQREQSQVLMRTLISAN